MVIDDEEALAPEWLAVTTASKPDKAAIKDALKAGRPIEGAQLLSRRSFRQRGQHHPLRLIQRWHKYRASPKYLASICHLLLLPLSRPAR